MYRLYIRTRVAERKHQDTKRRGFTAIGWYCPKCKFFETDERIERARKIDLRDSWGIETDEDFERVAKQMGIK